MSDETFRIVIASGVAIAALCIIVLTIAMIVLLRSVKQMRDKIVPFTGKIAPAADKIVPLLDILHASALDLAPKLKSVSTDAVEISRNAREQVVRTGELLKDFSERAKAQMARIDREVEHTVDSVHIAGESVKSAVLKPVREVNGVLSGIKTAISVFAQGRRESVDHATQDEEMFI